MTWNPTRYFTFFLRHFFAMKSHPTSHKMRSDQLENVAQCCFKKFDCRLFISKFSQFAFYFCLSFSVISESLAQPFCKCCRLSVSVVVTVQFTTKEMCVKNNTHVSRTSRNKMSTTTDLYCCLLPQCEALRCCCSDFPITKNGALTRMWRWCQVQPSQKERATNAVHCKNEGMLLQPLGWRRIDSVVFVWPIHEND